MNKNEERAPPPPEAEARKLSSKRVYSLKQKLSGAVEVKVVRQDLPAAPCSKRTPYSRSEPSAVNSPPEGSHSKVTHPSARPTVQRSLSKSEIRYSTPAHPLQKTSDRPPCRQHKPPARPASSVPVHNWELSRAPSCQGVSSRRGLQLPMRERSWQPLEQVHPPGPNRKT